MKFNYHTLHFLLIITLCSSVTAQVNRFELEDINRLTSISALQISPDGQSAIFMTSNRNMESNRFDRALILLDIQTKDQTRIAEQFKGLSSPAWSVDGQGITFLSRGDNGRQIYLLDLKTGESKVVVSADTDIRRYTWSPDGKQIAYLAGEKPQDNDENEYNDSFEVGSNDYLTDEPLLGVSVWLANGDGKNLRKITPDDFTVATGLSTSALTWSKNSRFLAFTKYPSPNPGDSDLGRNFIYDLTSHELRQATENTQRESSPIFSSEGNSLVYRFPRDGFPSNMSDLHQVNLETGEIKNITKEFDQASSMVTWMKDGSMLVRAIDKWGNNLFKLADGKSSKVNMGDFASIGSYSLAENGQMVFTAVGKDYPAEVYYKEDLDADPIQLTSFNSFINDFDLGEQEGLEWSSSDDLTPNGIVTYPPEFDPKRKYPLVLLIHGGPSSASLLGFSPIPQALAAQGWIIFQPNYRGSTNLGNEFQSAISKDPSEGPGHDVITGVNVLKEKPYVDVNRVAVSGWSYGGWMTSWLIGRYPDVWAAAVAGAAPVDFTDMYSLNDLNRMRRHSIVESPYVGDNLEWAYANSPISNFSKLRTPTLIMSKTGDYRVTITGSYKLYGALRDNGVPVEFIAYPGPGHFPSDPVRYQDVYKRWTGWLNKYLGNGRKLEATVEDR